MVAIFIIMVLVILAVARSNWRKTPVYFASKSLQKHKREIPPSLLNEHFETIPINERYTLKVSEHWLRVQTGKGKRGDHDIWFPKNFIIGIYYGFDLFDPEEDYDITFCLITGEKTYNVFKFYHPERDIFHRTMLRFKEILPQKTIVEAGRFLSYWQTGHEKQIKNYFNQLVEEKGILYLIENRVDFYDLFSMDGTMMYEIQPNQEVDVVLDEDEATGKITHGHVERFVDPTERLYQKKGCHVVIQEGRKTGRVKKVYGEPFEIKLDIHAPERDDSEEYYKEFPEERAKGEAEVQAMLTEQTILEAKTDIEKKAGPEYKNFTKACVFFTVSTWVLSILCFFWGFNEASITVFLFSLYMLVLCTCEFFGSKSKYRKAYRTASYHWYLAYGITILIAAASIFTLLIVVPKNSSLPMILLAGLLGILFDSKYTFLIVAAVTTIVMLIKFLSVTIRRKKGWKPDVKE
jgi:uncharacterized protein YwbE/ribosomal protein L28